MDDKTFEILPFAFASWNLMSNAELNLHSFPISSNYLLLGCFLLVVQYVIDLFDTSSDASNKWRITDSNR